MDVVPILVKIGLRDNGHADHPAWQNLPMIAAHASGGTPQRIDDEVRKHVHGGWHYDKTSGHEVETPESPRGQQLGMLLVTRQFADEAIATFPGIVTEMTQAECEAFWDNKAMVRLSDEDEDLDALQSLKTRHDLLVATNAPQPALNALQARINKALDPNDHSERGVKANPRRRFVNAKAHLGITFHGSVPVNRP
jgi:hypothetical protein